MASRLRSSGSPRAEPAGSSSSCLIWISRIVGVCPDAARVRGRGRRASLARVEWGIRERSTGRRRPPGAVMGRGSVPPDGGEAGPSRKEGDTLSPGRPWAGVTLILRPVTARISKSSVSVWKSVCTAKAPGYRPTGAPRPTSSVTSAVVALRTMADTTVTPGIATDTLNVAGSKCVNFPFTATRASWSSCFAWALPCGARRRDRRRGAAPRSRVRLPGRRGEGTVSSTRPSPPRPRRSRRPRPRTRRSSPCRRRSGTRPRPSTRISRRSDAPWATWWAGATRTTRSCGPTRPRWPMRTMIPRLRRYRHRSPPLPQAWSHRRRSRSRRERPSSGMGAHLGGLDLDPRVP
jgi:hypothetical protein